jgi:hypothetical protein
MLDCFSDDELKAELERRGKEQKSKPPPVPEPDFRSVKVLCANYLNDLEKQGWVDDDLQHCIFEAVMQALYGERVCEFIRSAM